MALIADSKIRYIIGIQLEGLSVNDLVTNKLLLPVEQVLASLTCPTNFFCLINPLQVQDGHVAHVKIVVSSQPKEYQLGAQTILAVSQHLERH